MAKSKIKLMIKKSYLAVVNNSLGSKMFRNCYALVNGRNVDIMRNGELSCAFFVSNVLLMFKLIKSGHGTVDGTVKDLIESGWQRIKRPRVGAVLVWAPVNSPNGESHKHIGFYMGRGQAISNSSYRKTVVKHDLYFGKKKRKIEMVWWKWEIEG